MSAKSAALENPDTREALLAAATEVFAEKGFRAARVRDIADLAGANLAAINYHFGGKQALYREVLRREAQKKIQRHPLLPAEYADAPASARLAGIVEAFFGRLFDEGNNDYAPRLIMRELADPTDAIDFLVDEIIGPQIQQIAGVIRELLGEDATPEAVKLAAFSVIGQCLYYKFAQPIASRVAPEFYDGGHWRKLATHIAEFSLEGLKTVKHYPQPREA